MSKTQQAIVLGLMLGVAVGFLLMRNGGVLHSIGAVVALVCWFGSILYIGVLYYRRKPTPEELRAPEMAGPKPRGVRFGTWYFNRHDPRPAAYDSRGFSRYINRANRRYWWLLALEVSAVVLMIGLMVRILVYP